MKDETRETLVNVGVIVAWLVSMFVVLPWVIDELGAIPLSDMPALALSGFGLMAWMLFRIEQAVNRGNATLSVVTQEGRPRCDAMGRFDTSTIREAIDRGSSTLSAVIQEGSRSQCDAINRVEFDTTFIRDTLEQAVSHRNGTTDDIADQIRQLRGDLNDVVKLLEEIRGNTAGRFGVG